MATNRSFGNMLNSKKPMSKKQIGWLMAHKKNTPGANTAPRLNMPQAPKAPKFSGWGK